ncbi:mitogen-activated protein kinase kinase kinase kinase 2 isoform X1 [Corythoichthys intestinalis]|uniref:mitogen-activated protein kinase kinase kinase kinase 2 isoform X1 n=1 Tax=Corythoichthys intestinalis TaxID=161448 RepID=UPI0025A52FD6|nr:mitogen-activated protein kinase kinase kinase kinase 2 isoform X1 [Corythoichthys intestinalis]
MDRIGVSFLDPLDDYELLHRIGCGTYGDVFKARNIRTSELAAVKIVKLDACDDITSIQQEITMMKECQHKNIVAYFGSYHRNAKLWICMEYCGGGSLQDIYHGASRFFFLTSSTNSLVVPQSHRSVKGETDCVRVQRKPPGFISSARNGQNASRYQGRQHPFDGTRRRQTGGFRRGGGDQRLRRQKEVFHRNALLVGALVSPRRRRGILTRMAPRARRMAPEVAAAAEKKGGYDHLCDIWAVGITAIELAELRPPMFDLHPMRALMLMSKSGFRPPKLKEKNKWSPTFRSFVKTALVKNPRKRPPAERLLQHPFVTQLLTRNLAIELLDAANDPEPHASYGAEDLDPEMDSEAPDKIPSAGKRLSVKRTVSEEQFDQVTFGTPLRKVGEPYPDSSSYDDADDWSLSGEEEDRSPSLLECVEQALQLRRLTIRRAPSTDGSVRSGSFSPTTASLPAFCSSSINTRNRDATQSRTLGPLAPAAASVLSRCSATRDVRRRGGNDDDDPCPPAGGAATAEIRKETGLSPEWRTLRKKTEESRADFHGLPPTPRVHMGACFSKVFNGCPLKIHCAVTWISPSSRDQYLILGAEEGIYTLNLNELHEDTLEKLLPQRCTWLYVMNDVLMSVSGKSSQLYSHGLTALFEQKGHLAKKHGGPSRSGTRKCASAKIPDTKGCRRCSVARNPYTDSTFLCGAVPSGLVLLLWYEPLQKFMHLKQLAARLPDPLVTFELLVSDTDEFPQLCVGVRDCADGSLRFDIIELNGSPVSEPGTTVPLDPVTNGIRDRGSSFAESGALEAVRVIQLDRDTLLIALEKRVKIVNLRGFPSEEPAAEMLFDFPIETLVCLQDSALAFWKHGLKGKSFHSNEVTQEITDESRVFRVLGTNRDIILQSTPTNEPSAPSNVYILTGHESSY